MTSDLTVLIVDDEPDVAALHARVVETQEGYSVSEIVHGGEQALEAIERLRPHVMLLDFGLPDIDGPEVLRRLRASDRPGIEVIAITAAKDLASVRYARSAGIHHYLVKPFAVSTLRERLERVLADRAMVEDTRGEVLEQDSVDLILGGGRPPTKVSPLPKGLGPGTLERVRSVLHAAQEPVSAAQIAHEIGASRVTARRYLEFLHQTGEAILRPKYGRGRPENRYAAR